MKNINCFYLCNGIQLWNLEDLKNELSKMEDDVFYYHVNDDKNDFALWILGEIKDKVLAHQISKTKDKLKIIKFIDKRINTESKKRKNIIEQIKEAMINE